MMILGTIGDDIQLTSEGWVCQDKSRQKDLEELFPLSSYGPSDGWYGYKALADASALLGQPFNFTGPQEEELTVDPATELQAMLDRLADQFGGEVPDPEAPVDAGELAAVVEGR